MPASNYVKQRSLNAWVRGQQMTSPSAVYVALYLTNPTASNSGTELSGNGYARTAATFGSPAISGDQAICSNSSVVQFQEATGNWGTPLYFGILDSFTGGNLLFYAPLPTSFAITTGMAPKFNIGELRVTAQ